MIYLVASLMLVLLAGACYRYGRAIAWDGEGRDLWKAGIAFLVMFVCICLAVAAATLGVLS